MYKHSMAWAAIFSHYYLQRSSRLSNHSSEIHQKRYIWAILPFSKALIRTGHGDRFYDTLEEKTRGNSTLICKTLFQMPCDTGTQAMGRSSGVHNIMMKTDTALFLRKNGSLAWTSNSSLGHWRKDHDQRTLRNEFPTSPTALQSTTVGDHLSKSDPG